MIITNTVYDQSSLEVKNDKTKWKHATPLNTNMEPK